MKKIVIISVLIVVLFTMGNLIINRTQRTSIEVDPIDYNAKIKNDMSRIAKKMPESEEETTVVLNSGWKNDLMAREVNGISKLLQKISYESQNSDEENTLIESEQISKTDNTIQIENTIDTNNNEQVIVDNTSVPNEGQQIASYPYYIKINCAQNVVNIYKEDENGNYSVPLKAMLCSTRKCNATVWSIYLNV